MLAPEAYSVGVGASCLGSLGAGRSPQDNLLAASPQECATGSERLAIPAIYHDREVGWLGLWQFGISREPSVHRLDGPSLSEQSRQVIRRTTGSYRLNPHL